MKAKVMVIEDDPSMLNLLRTLLSLEGYPVSTVDYDTDLPDILAEIRAIQPELVILDVHLRQVSGAKLLEEIRHDHSLDSVRILMSSGMDLSEQCLKNGAQGFLLKPYMPNDLLTKIIQVLNNHDELTESD